MIYGHIVCQNAIPDILRAVESINYCVDKTLIVDGGSTDGTREFLEERKDIYNLEIFDNKFDTLKNQRQFLLDKTPKNEWVIVLDQDEKFSQIFTYGIREFIKRIDPKLIDNPGRALPLVVPIDHFNLINDLYHYSGRSVMHNMRVFYNDKDLIWVGHDYHCTLGYKSEKEQRNVIITPYTRGFDILHYARLNPKRIKWRQNNLGKDKFGNYDKNSWKEVSEVNNLPVESY